MSETEKKLIEIYRSIAKGSIEHDINLDSEISRELGFDSLGMVNFVVEIEEEFDLELDKYLAAIRSARTLSDIVRIVENAKICS